MSKSALTPEHHQALTNLRNWAKSQNTSALPQSEGTDTLASNGESGKEESAQPKAVWPGKPNP